jgi:hypothetical protein
MTLTCSDVVYQYFCTHGAWFLGFTLTFQLARCLYINLYPAVDGSGLKMTDYQMYLLAAFLMMIAAMYFFLVEAVKRKSPSSIVSFLILVAIFNIYMIFRDIVFINWPTYYFKSSNIETG